MPSDPPRQQAIPDRLAELREQLNALQAEENTLRAILINDPTTRLGAGYIATIKTLTRPRIRLRDLQQANPDLYRQLVSETPVQQVWLTNRPET